MLFCFYLQQTVLSQGLLGSMCVQFLVHTNVFFHSLFSDLHLTGQIVLIQYQMVWFVDKNNSNGTTKSWLNKLALTCKQGICSLVKFNKIRFFKKINIYFMD